MENVQEKKKQCEMKTDLNLLLECLKYQMDNPDSQKEVLVTIYSVCQLNSDASDYFREIGGLMLVRDIAKSSVYSIVKEAALFTLGALAESNVYCQQMLCTSELFNEVMLASSNKCSSLNLKRMSVYVILVLISNNKAGQTLARETGCIDILLQLFRETLSISEISPTHLETSSYQLWSSVCSTLCACANNPQNDENQKKCCSVFPYANMWLQNVMSPEVVRPVCSFIGLTVANNTSVQEYFAHIGGLDTLADLLVKLVDDSHTNNSSAKIAVVVTKTLDACIADNPAIGIVLSKYHIVSSLLKLLLHDSLDTGDKFSIILTLGHCTEDCEENQYDLLKSNGLPLMIQVLTESQDEEINKAITFVLQNCKQITEDLSLRLNERSSNMNDASSLEDKQRKGRNINDYWKKAKEILQRIELLERQHQEEIKCSFQTMETLDANQKPLNIGIKKVVCYPQPKEMSPTKNTLNDKLHTRPCFSQRPSEADGHGDSHSKQFQNDKSGRLLYDGTPASFKEKSQQCSTTKINEEVGTNRDRLLMERVRRQIFVDDDMVQGSITEKRSDHLRMKASDGKVSMDERHKKMLCMQTDASVCSALPRNHISNLVLETGPINTAKAGNKENRSNVPQSVNNLEPADNSANKQHVCGAVCPALQIRFQEDFYLQKSGTAMGSNVAPCYTNIFMSELEEDKIMNNLLWKKHIILWVRYIDDLFTVWRGDQESLDEFHGFLNSIHTTIKFSMDGGGKVVHFLDTLVTLNQGNFEFDIFVKPTDRNSLLQAHSHHPKNMVKSLPYSQLLRIKRIVSNQEQCAVRSKEMQSRFRERGYKEHWLREASAMVDTKTREELLISKSPDTRHSGPIFTSMYSPKSKAIRNTIMKHWHIFQCDSKTKILFQQPPLFSYSRSTNLRLIGQGRFERYNIEAIPYWETGQGVFPMPELCPLQQPD